MRKRMRSYSVNNRLTRATAMPLRNSPRRFSRPFVPFSIGNSGSVPLTRFRQVTHFPKIGRASSQSGPHFSRIWHTKLLHQNLKYLDPKGVDRIRQALPSLTKADMEKICKDRKERREVMFAKGISGGPHRPPTYNFKSLVRC